MEPPIASVLHVAERVKEQLIACSLSLSMASKWASRDRFSFNPLNGIFAMPLKYWHLRKARQELASAESSCAELRKLIEVELQQSEIAVSKVAIALDLWGEASVWFDGTPGTELGYFAEVWADVHIENQLETSLVSVNGLLDDVGLLCAKLRMTAANEA